MTQITDTPTVKGIVNIKHINADGVLIEERTIPNIVVQNGLQYFAARAIGTPTGATGTMTHMAIGFGTAANTSTSQTTLSSECVGGSNARVSLGTPTSSQNTITYGPITFGAGNGSTGVTEAGIFNQATYGATGVGGTMLCRTTFGVINKGSADSLAITWTITVGTW